jgi:hypothetical protein
MPVEPMVANRRVAQPPRPTTTEIGPMVVLVVGPTKAQSDKSTTDSDALTTERTNDEIGPFTCSELSTQAIALPGANNVAESQRADTIGTRE